MLLTFIRGKRSFSGSNIGGIAETQEMLNFFFGNNIVTDVEIVKADEVNKASEPLGKGDGKYRFLIDMASL